MVEIVDKYIEIAITIFIYVTSATLTIALLVIANNPIIEQSSDKTFIESTGVQEIYDADSYGYDILILLLNADSMAPYPKAIKINNTPVIKLTNEFIAHKMGNVSNIYSIGGDYKLSTILDHKIVSEEYVYKGIDAPYIHYVLKEVE